MSDVLNWYASYLKNWHLKVGIGPKPTAEMFATVHDLGLRPGKQALANAMALRPNGVTNAQIIQACGNPQLNRMRGLISDKLVKRVPTPSSNEGHVVYRIELTAKGQQRIESARKRAEAAEAEANGEAEAKPARKRPSKAAGKRNSKGKADTAKPETPTSEAAKPADGQVADAGPFEGAPVITDQHAA